MYNYIKVFSNYLGTAQARKFVSYNPALIDVKKLRTDNLLTEID